MEDFTEIGSSSIHDWTSSSSKESRNAESSSSSSLEQLYKEALFKGILHLGFPPSIQSFSLVIFISLLLPNSHLDSQFVGFEYHFGA